jgi:elongation factor Tu
VGKILRGSVRVGSMVEIVGLRETTRLARMTGVEMPQFATSEDLVKHLQRDSRSLLLHDVTPADLERGQVLAAPGSIRAGTRFQAALRFAPDAQGLAEPFADAYRVVLHLWGADVYSTIQLPPGKTTIAPGDSFTAAIELTRPVALEPGLTFHIGRALGSGQILALR